MVITLHVVKTVHVYAVVGLLKRIYILASLSWELGTQFSGSSSWMDNCIARPTVRERPQDFGYGGQCPLAA